MAAHLHRAGVRPLCTLKVSASPGTPITLTAGRIRSRAADRPDEMRTHAAMRRADGYFAHDSDRNLRICARHKIADSLIGGQDARRIAGGRYRLCDGTATAAAVPPLPQESAAAQSPAADYQNERSKHIMRIAVTYENGTIFQHFGHTAAVQAVRCGERRRSAHSAGSRHERQRPRCPCRLPDRASGRRADLRRHRRRRTDCACAGRHSTVRRCFGQRRRSCSSACSRSADLRSERPLHPSRARTRQRPSHLRRTRLRKALMQKALSNE